MTGASAQMWPEDDSTGWFLASSDQMEEMLGQCVLCCVLCHSLGSRVKGGGQSGPPPAYSSYREVEVRFRAAQLDCFLVTDIPKFPVDQL